MTARKDTQQETIQHLRKSLHDLIIARSKTVERFAHENDIEQSVLSKFFAGKSALSLVNFLHIVEVLDVELSSLVPKAKITKVGSGKTPAYDPRPVRRTRVTVNLAETRTIEIKKKPGDTKAILELQLSSLI